MFLSPFDPGYDFEPPSGSALLAEIGIDRSPVSEVIERRLRDPLSRPGLPSFPTAPSRSSDTRTPFEQALHEAALLNFHCPSPAHRHG